VRRPSGGEDFSLTPILPKDAAREMMEPQLMTAQIRVHDLDLDEILRQPVAEIGEGTFQPLR